jgi:hypothetical protein
MPGVPRELVEHALQIIPSSKPVRQAMRRFGDEKHCAITKEISKPLKAGFVKEVIHTKWVANPVLVPKKNTKVLRMCVNYTGLNKACPKDPFPLPCIDQVIDSTVGSELLCFLDAYSGYHQIKMKESDQLATLFVTPYGTYCYVMMPFGLKMQEQLTSAQCKSAWQIRLVATSTPTWTISPLCPKSRMTS